MANKQYQYSTLSYSKIHFQCKFTFYWPHFLLLLKPSRRICWHARKDQIPVLSVLLFILSLNLFSLHNNVLKNRRQEIAIKRALGFSKKEIVMEFLLEGTIIFLINLLITSFIIFSIGVLWHYKNYQLIRGVYPVSIMIYPFSLKIFLVSSIFLTILNSVVLAFLATRINIIDAIKTE